VPLIPSLTERPLPPGEGGRQAMPRSALDSKIRALKINKHRCKTG